MTEENLPGNRMEHPPAEGSVVFLGLFVGDRQQIDVMGYNYNGCSDGVHSFIRPEKYSVSISNASKGEFRQDPRGIIFYSGCYNLDFVDNDGDQERFKDLVSKLKLWRKK